MSRKIFFLEFINPYIIRGGIDMNNMINVGGMMGYYNNYIQAVNRGSDIKKLIPVFKIAMCQVRRGLCL